MKPSGFELNKVVAALLFAGVVAMGTALIASILYKGGEGHTETKRGYTITGAEAFEAGGAGAPAVAKEEEKPVDILPFMAKADVEAGKAQIKKCAACHSFEKDGKNGVGPNQWALVGSNFGHRDDYAYSDALKAQHGKRKWNEQELSEFLANPKKYLPGNKMSFAGIKKPEDRANLIAYLKTLK